MTEEQIKDAYIKALSILIENREQFVEDARLLKAALTDTTEIEKKITAVRMEMDAISGRIRQCIESNATQAQNQDDYNAYYTSLADNYDQQKQALEELEVEMRERAYKADILSGFMFEITELPDMNIAFSDIRFSKTVDHITVHNDGRMVFSFYVGKDITVEM